MDCFSEYFRWRPHVWCWNHVRLVFFASVEISPNQSCSFYDLPRRYGSRSYKWNVTLTSISGIWIKTISQLVYYHILKSFFFETNISLRKAQTVHFRPDNQQHHIFILNYLSPANPPLPSSVMSPSFLPPVCLLVSLFPWGQNKAPPASLQQSSLGLETSSSISPTENLPVFRAILTFSISLFSDKANELTKVSSFQCSTLCLYLAYTRYAKYQMGYGSQTEIALPELGCCN